MRHTIQLLARSLVAAFTLGATATVSSSAMAQSAVDEQPGAKGEDVTRQIITVEGVGEIALPPDSLRTSVAVEVRDVKLDVARDQAARRTQEVLRALQALAIPELEARTVEVAISPITEVFLPAESVRDPRILGYSVSSRLSVALRGLPAERLRAEGARILEAALAAGANSVGGLEFFLKDSARARRMALAAAVREAEANAGVIAGAAKIKLVGLRSISAAREEPSFVQVAQAGIGGAPSATFPVEPGDVRVTATVTIRVSFAP